MDICLYNNNLICAFDVTNINEVLNYEIAAEEFIKGKEKESLAIIRLHKKQLEEDNAYIENEEKINKKLEHNREVLSKTNKYKK